MKLIDVIEQCADNRESPRPVEDIQGFAVHRIGFEDWTIDRLEQASPVNIARRFIDDPEVAKYTGGELPYTFLIDGAGIWWQCLRLTDVGRHARRWNAPMVGVGVIGDFRRQPPQPMQRAALVDGLAEMLPALGIDPLGQAWLGALTAPRLAGHDELPGGSADTGKRCPGQHLSMRDLRRDVALSIERRALAGLAQVGVVV